MIDSLDFLKNKWNRLIIGGTRANNNRINNDLANKKQRQVCKKCFFFSRFLATLALNIINVREVLDGHAKQM